MDAWGEPEQLRLGDAPEPAVEGSIRIRVRAAGINFFDLLQLRGQYQYKPPFPFTPGAEVCGMREDTGERVIAFCQQGGYAEVAAAPPDRVFPAPDHFDDAEAAAFLIVYQTSLFVLTRRAKLQPGETLLVHAGASGTGMSAIQIGLALGARVWATAGSDDKLAFCRELGAERVFSYRDADWVQQAKGVDVVYDPVGGDAFDLSTKVLNPEGRLAVVGFASGRIPTIAANRLLLKNISVVGAVWGGFLATRPSYVAEAHQGLLELMQHHDLKPRVRQRYAFADAPRALRDVDSRQVIGKAVLVL